MSFPVIVDGSNVGKPKRVTVQATRNTLLSNVKEEACRLLQLQDTANLTLYSPTSRKTLDLSLPIRLASLTPNTKLELTSLQNRSKGGSQKITIAIQPLKQGNRCIVEATGQDTLQNIVERAQSSGDHSSFLEEKARAVVYYLNQPIRNLDKRLQDLGIVQGSVLFKLDWEYVDEDQKKKEEEDKKPNLVTSLPSTREWEEEKKTREETKIVKEEPPSECNPSVEASNYPVANPSSQDISCHSEQDDNLEEHSNDILDDFQTGRLRLYQPSNRNLDPSAVELPESFYDFTLGDLETWRAEQQQQKPEPVLMTRRRQGMQQSSLYTTERVIVRIKLPDGIYLEACLNADDTLDTVYALLKKLLLAPFLDKDVYLFTSPPPKRWVNRDIRLAQWSPGISFYLGGVDRSLSSSAILKPIVYQQLQSSPYEKVIEREETKAQEIRQEYQSTSHVDNKTTDEKDESTDRQSKSLQTSENNTSATTTSRSFPAWLKGFRK